MIEQIDSVTLCNILGTKIRELFDTLDIEYMDHGNYLSFVCPIHEGADNPSGCTITTEGEFIGIWKCWTRGCEKSHVHSILGLIRGVLGRIKDKKVSFSETVSFCLEFLDLSREQLNNKHKLSPDIIDKISRSLNISVKKAAPNITREEIRKSLQRPAKYYLNRGFSKETLDVFDVGLCNAKGKSMYKRVVAPVYDENYVYVGCVGRTQHENHNGYKWVNSKGFNSGSYLYGLWLTKDNIRSSNTAILVEGQGDVWKLWEAGIRNAVGIFGSSLSDTQSGLLQMSGAHKIIILTDNDEAGEKARKSIKQKCQTLFIINEPTFSSKDVGDMTTEQILSELKHQL